MKKQKGITLIALVITVIVLLVLAGVALATLTGQGNIVENANKSVEKYNEKALAEQGLLNEIEKKLIEYSNGGGTSTDTPPEPEEPDTPPTNPETKTALELKQTGELDIGDFVTYTMGDTDYTNATPADSGYTYVKDSAGNAVTGWRIFDIADDGTVTLISAGNPENYYHKEDSAASVSGIEALASKYRNSRYDTTGAAMLNKTILDAWYSKYMMSGAMADTYTNSTFRTVYGTRYESIIDNYSDYWLASDNGDILLYFVYPYSTGMNSRYAGSFGVRPLVYLSANVKITGKAGTKTLIDPRNEANGTNNNWTYNVWTLQEKQ